MKLLIMLLWSLNIYSQGVHLSNNVPKKTKIISVKDYIDSLETEMIKTKMYFNYISDFKTHLNSQDVNLKAEAEVFQLVALKKVAYLSKIIKNYYKMKGNRVEVDSLSAFQAKVAGNLYYLKFKFKEQ